MKESEEPKPMPDAPGSVALITSPHAGTASGADPRATLERAGVPVAFQLDVRQLGELTPQGEEWRQAGIAAVVAAGGDGTVGTVASHVARTGLALGILPLGTANDVARSLDLPLTLPEAAAVIARGHSTLMDMGCARPAGTHTDGEYFLHALTLGWNAAFAELATNALRRQRWGKLTYAISAVEAIFTYRPLEVRIELQDVAASVYGLDFTTPPEGNGSHSSLAVKEKGVRRVVSGHVVNLGVVVTPVFGGRSNFRLPSVGLRDQLLDVVVIEAPDPPRLAWFYEVMTGKRGALGQGAGEAAASEATRAARRRRRAPHDGATQLMDRPGVWRFKAGSLSIATPGTEDAPVTLDGEPRMRTPVEVNVEPDALRVYVPQPVSEANGG
jgi:diacylglycerol kinase family enzyme